MSQRNSGYRRKRNDAYDTPEWVTWTLADHLPSPSKVRRVWEPACGKKQKMARALRAMGYRVKATDIITGKDFLSIHHCQDIDAIVTNPPFGKAQEFIEHALELMVPVKGTVAMLARADFDHASTRQHLFGECQQFAGKICLIKRIVWFPRKGAAPSYNHAWFMWDTRRCPPTIHYEGMPK